MSTESVYNSRGRPIIFTPERMEQIRNLVERGHSREEIAEIIGCTVGSLAVTCSRLGISLRRPKNGASAFVPRLVPNGNGGYTARLLPVREPPKPPAPPTSSNGNGKPQPEQIITIALHIEYHGRTREFDIPLSREHLTRLMFEAEIRGINLAELLARILKAHIEG